MAGDPRGSRHVGVIDMAPTWEGLIPMFIAAIENGTPTARSTAIDELYRLAQFADKKNADAKAIAS